MALIDSNIFNRNPGPSYLGAGIQGYDQAMQARDAATQRQQAMMQQNRQNGFRRAMTGLLGKYGESIRTPEGQNGLVRDLAKQGYGEEAMGLFGKMPEIPQAKAPEQGIYESDAGPYAYDKSNPAGTMTPIPGVKPPTKPDAQRTPTFKPGDDGYEHEWDPATRKFVRTNLKSKKDVPKPEGLKPEQIFTQEQQLRTQFLGQTKDFRDVRDAFGRIKVSSKNPSAAGDLSLIFNYMKMLDPGSTVREGEFATAAASGSLGDRFVAAGKKLLSGERLDPSQRADFLNRAQSLYGQQQRQHEKAKFETRKMASAYPGLNADRITMDADLAEDEGAAIPTHDQYDSLPSGAEFTDPDGNVRRKP